MDRTVLWVTSTFPTAANPIRGVFVAEQAAYVAAHWRLHVLVQIPWLPPLPRYRIHRCRLSGLPSETRSSDYTVHYLPVPYIPQWKLGANFGNVTGIATATLWAAWWLRKWQQKPDLIHAHMGSNALLGAVLARRTRAPLITTAYGSDVNYGLGARRGNFVRRRAISYGLRHSEIVIGVSEALCRRVEGLGIPRRKTVQIPNGFDASKFRPMGQQETRRKLGLPLEKKIALYVGNLVPVKGVDVLLEAFGRLRSLRDGPILYCIGDGPDRSQLEARISELGLSRSAFLVGERPHGEIPQWMNACDLFVLASRNEGWPTVLSEALACGKPAVGTAVGGIPEILSADYLGETVEPESPEALADAIRRVLVRPVDSQRIRARSLEYTWDNIASKLSEVYAGVLAA